MSGAPSAGVAPSLAEAGVGTLADADFMVATAAKDGLNGIALGVEMNEETLLGAILIAAWAAVVLGGLTRTFLAARKEGNWERAYLVGLGVGCAFAVGVVLSIKNSLPLDTYGLGFFLAAGAGFAIWAFGRRVPAGNRKAPVRPKRQTVRRVPPQTAAR